MLEGEDKPGFSHMTQNFNIEMPSIHKNTNTMYTDNIYKKADNISIDQCSCRTFSKEAFIIASDCLYTSPHEGTQQFYLLLKEGASGSN